MPHQPIKIAILDLYERQPNEGMRCIKNLLNDYARLHQLNLQYDEFEVRVNKQLPNIVNYQIFISTGGPGSPIDSKGTEWEQAYFNWIEQVEIWNGNDTYLPKKKIFFICHSFQLACRYFQLADVVKRKSTAFGVFPVHFIPTNSEDPVWTGLKNPFYAVDSRDYQVITPNAAAIEKAGATILCIEKERPHVPLERAIMAIRFNAHMVGTQFHPEADAEGMSRYLLQKDKKKIVVTNHGLVKWQSMLAQLNDPDKIMLTQAHILPNFLDECLKQKMEDRA
jgi:homoserine O-succinyltransferase/O-acetyltransferase